MPFELRDFQDLVRLLREHPDWREELRALLLTQEILTLPVLVRQLAEGQERPAHGRPVPPADRSPAGPAHRRDRARMDQLTDDGGSTLAEEQRRLTEEEDRTAVRGTDGPDAGLVPGGALPYPRPSLLRSFPAAGAAGTHWKVGRCPAGAVSRRRTGRSVARRPHPDRAPSHPGPASGDLGRRWKCRRRWTAGMSNGPSGERLSCAKPVIPRWR